jgi:hypothetical protein
VYRYDAHHLCSLDSLGKFPLGLRSQFGPSAFLDPAHTGHITRQQGGVHALVEGINTHPVEGIHDPCYFIWGTEVPWLGFATPTFDASLAAEFGWVEVLRRAV